MVFGREQQEKMERDHLAPYAAFSADTTRVHDETPPHSRTEFERDWNRIAHARAFRRLEFKTQVMPFGTGSDVSRNRLTHTLEATQIVEGIARPLGLNTGLVKAIVMAHDLGHPPFGHRGEEALHACAEAFNHNQHSLRIVTDLEHRYPAWNGLNLTLLTLEGIEKHETDYDIVGSYNFFPGQSPTLEAQISNYADTIAYRAHDIEDALESGIIKPEQFSDVAFWDRVQTEVEKEMPGCDPDGSVWLAQTSRKAINIMIQDVIETTESRVRDAGVQSLEDVRNVKADLAGFSDEMEQMQAELGAFLMDNFYNSPPVFRACRKGMRIIEALFNAYLDDEFKLLPRRIQEQIHVHGGSPDDPEVKRMVADFIAGMTDRYAANEYINIFEVGDRHSFDPQIWRALMSAD
jgi:dGTPase